LVDVVAEGIDPRLACVGEAGREKKFSMLASRRRGYTNLHGGRIVEPHGVNVTLGSAHSPQGTMVAAAPEQETHPPVHQRPATRRPTPLPREWAFLSQVK